MNLQQIYGEIIRKYFSHLDNIPACRISQGQLKDNRRVIVFGTYNARKNEIRIHPILLGENVPREALEFVLYHELLHFEDRPYLLRRRKGEGVHTKEFRQREKLYPQYKEAKTALNTLFKEGAPANNAPKLKGEALSEALQASLGRLEKTLERYGLGTTAAMKKIKQGKTHD